MPWSASGAAPGMPRSVPRAKQWVIRQVSHSSTGRSGSTAPSSSRYPNPAGTAAARAKSSSARASASSQRPWDAVPSHAMEGAPSVEVPRQPSRADASALDRPRQQPPDEVPLQRDEDDERDDDRDERPGGEQVPVLAPGPGHLREPGGERLHGVVAAGERQPDEQVVPHPEELEDREGRDRRDQEREHDPEEQRDV